MKLSVYGFRLNAPKNRKGDGINLPIVSVYSACLAYGQDPRAERICSDRRIVGNVVLCGLKMSARNKIIRNIRFYII